MFKQDLYICALCFQVYAIYAYPTTYAPPVYIRRARSSRSETTVEAFCGIDQIRRSHRTSTVVKDQMVDVLLVARMDDGINLKFIMKNI